VNLLSITKYVRNIFEKLSQVSLDQHMFIFISYRAHLPDVNNYLTYSDTTSLSKNFCYDIAVLQILSNVLRRFNILKADSTHFTFFNQLCDYHHVIQP